ncbi:hypothetical protein NP590_17900 [Methylomonas sp. SURF-2]|uniref:MITD1 C-terminal phospholipase D-like domain-containing protein n=1 Tax=Methylomonas subterranea TaxID=2952225 RepID=A0ABT1TKI0_9GAMM|nr:hypothetical protein [Methylomonas sp. SURF-2]MCQ8105987.1 hypothetical protein [Methylomonas sp. SURF-2]
MIYEYAVSPALFKNISDVAFLYEAFGIDQGRLISEYPRKRKWTQYARELIKKHARDDSERNALIELLIALEKRALYERQSVIWDDNKKWIENAVDEHSRRPFRAILNHQPTEQADVTTIADTWKVPQWKSPPSFSVSRNAKQMVDAASPLLHLSRVLVLIDRNFEPADARFSKVLIEFARRLQAQAHAPKILQIKYVTTYESNNRTIGQFESECKSVLHTLLPTGISVKFFIKAKRLLHDRFVLTDRGCLQYGIGLDEGDGDVLVTRLSNDNFTDEWNKWEQNSCHNFVIEGSGQ